MWRTIRNYIHYKTRIHLYIHIRVYYITRV